VWGIPRLPWSPWLRIITWEVTHLLCQTAFTQLKKLSGSVFSVVSPGSCSFSNFVFRLVWAATEAQECFFLHDQLLSPHAFYTRAKSPHVYGDERDSLISKMTDWAAGLRFQARTGFFPSPLRPDDGPAESQQIFFRWFCSWSLKYELTQA
jgi:hypothetical protein